MYNIIMYNYNIYMYIQCYNGNMVDVYFAYTPHQKF